MQIEITLTAATGDDYNASDLGFLLHKHPDHLFRRHAASGEVSVFYSTVGEWRTTAVMYLDIDPVALVRGKSKGTDGLLSHYVNDRPYVANSFLSVALARSFGQTLAGKSKGRQDLADRPLPHSARVVPVAASGGPALFEQLFQPLGYAVEATALEGAGARGPFDLRLTATCRLADLLNHLYVLIPVLDDAKHYWIDKGEIEKLLAKGEGWLAAHPARDIIARRALQHRRELVHMALARLAEEAPEEEGETGQRQPGAEQALERPLRLHEQRLDAVAEALRDSQAASLLDLGCGEGRLIRHLLEERGIGRIVGVDASVRDLQRAARRLRLDRHGDALRARVSLQMGSLTYGDRRWLGFDAATLVEVVEHIDPPRLSALEASLFGEARPRTVVVTTPNREHNVLFETLPAGTLRHPDHRFEWTRAEFRDWAGGVAGRNGYEVAYRPVGNEDPTHGAPSQMAVFTRVDGEGARP